MNHVTHRRSGINAVYQILIFDKMAATEASLAGHDEEQIRLMEERCIVTDNEDNMLRDGSKKECTYA